MADQIDYVLEGDDFQSVVIRLDSSEAVQAEPGAMLYMERGVEIETTTGGGIMSGLKRKIAGESFFISTFENRSSQEARVAFAGDVPGKILALDLSRGSILCQRDSYLCSASGVEVTIAFTRRFGAGLFGGEGFILQRLSGDGMAFVNAGGHILERELKDGDELSVDTGCLAAMDESVDYDIQRVRGVKSMLFGGEGLFLAKLRGPGTVWLQTTPLSRLANRIMAASGGGRGQVRRGGSLLGGLVQGD